MCIWISYAKIIPIAYDNETDNWIQPKMVTRSGRMCANCVESPYLLERLASQLLEIYVYVNIRPTHNI